MRFFRVVLAMSTVAVIALCSGCNHDVVTAPNAAPGISPGTNRQAMIQYHRQHDKRP